MRLGATLHAFDARCHRALDDQRVRIIVAKHTAKIDVQRVKVLAHRRLGGKAIARKCAAQVIADHVLLRMAGNGHVIVIDHHLDIEVLAQHQTSGLRVVPFHLAAIGAKQNDGLSRICEGDSITESP
jgi:hypothetical protein